MDSWLRCDEFGTNFIIGNRSRRRGSPINNVANRCIVSCLTIQNVELRSFSRAFTSVCPWRPRGMAVYNGNAVLCVTLLVNRWKCDVGLTTLFGMSAARFDGA